MTCYRPIPVERLDDGSISFAPRLGCTEMAVPCGKCVGCLKTRADAWTTRILNEASCHRDNCFLTLTYDSEHVPVGLQYSDYQLFMRRLRRRHKVRFFMCGEYGTRFKRPHFHAVIFGWFPSDAVQFDQVNGNVLYRSSELESLWTVGFSSVGTVTAGSASYVAGYLLKSARRSAELVPDTGELLDLRTEFCRMSTNPGIGAKWLDRYVTDVTNNGFVVRAGRKFAVPRYYLKRVSRYHADKAFDLDAALARQAQKQSVEDCSEERLKVRESIAKARVAVHNRSAVE